jgi:hypothetical protein
MSQIGRTPMGRAGGSPGSNIYTVLALIALLALLVSVVYVIVRSRELTGQGNPFLVDKPTAGMVLPVQPGR